MQTIGAPGIAADLTADTRCPDPRKIAPRPAAPSAFADDHSPVGIVLCNFRFNDATDVAG